MFIDYNCKNKKIGCYFSIYRFSKTTRAKTSFNYYKITANFLVCFNVLKKGLIFLGTALFMKKKN